MRKLLLKIAAWGLAALVMLVFAGWIAFVPSAKEQGYVFVLAWGSKGSANGQFDDPTGIAVTPDEIFVSDARNDRIQVFDHEGRFLRKFGNPGDKPGELGRPMNLTIGGDKLYVPEFFNDRIQVFTLDGMPHRIIGKAGSGAGAFNAPGGVAVSRDGAVYVADFYNHRIQKLSSDGTFVRQWGKPKPGGKELGLQARKATGNPSSVVFSYPTDVAIAADGTLFVADGYNDRVQVFKPDGAFSHKWGGPFAMNIYGPFNGRFATVTSIAVGPKGNIFVADYYNHRIQKFASDGTFLTSFGHRGSDEGAFHYPIAVAVAPDGRVFVADYGNNRITKWLPR